MFSSTPTTSRRCRTAIVAVAFALVATACGSDGANTATLSNGAITVDGEAQLDAARSSGDLATFRYDDLVGDGTSEISALRGTPVVVNFFATWCAACIEEMPDFQQVHTDRINDVAFVGLAMQSPIDKVHELVAQTGVTYDIGVDQNGEIFSQLGGLGMPTTVFINADGTIARVHSGTLDAEGLSEIIDDELLT